MKDTEGDSLSMTRKPEAETLFESFCHTHRIAWERIPNGQTRTPDYLVYLLDGESVYFEVKQLDADDSFDASAGHYSRNVGAHIRKKIADARKQVQPGASEGVPCVLLVYNNLDPRQAFGTEPHDFISAMYGEMTVVLKDNVVTDSFHGRNAFLRQGHNTSFSAVGHIRKSAPGTTIQLYENVFACNPLSFSSIPACIEVVRIEVAENAA